MRRVAQLTAIILLAWTAFDLADPQCCLSGWIGDGRTAMRAPAPAQTASQGQEDDCFCCARCLDTGMRVPRFDVAISAATFDEPAERLIARSSALDHPPQNA